MPANINTPPPPTRKPTTSSQTPYIIAWFLCLVFYLLQYSTRSAPSVMVSELVSSFGLTTVGLGSLLGLYYYTYSFCSIISGAAVDRWGAKYTISFGALVLAVGTCLFGWGKNGWQALAALCRVRARLLPLWARFIWRRGAFPKSIWPRLWGLRSARACWAVPWGNLP